MSTSALHLAISLLISTGYCLASVGCGHAVLRACGRIAVIPLRRGMDSLLTAFLLGICVLAVLWLALALRGWLAFPVVTGVLAACSALGFGPAWRDLTGLRSPAREHFHWWKTQNPGFRIATALALVLIALLAIGALIKPPIGDAEAFYMAYAVIIADSERLIPMPGLYTTFSQIGLFGELHFAALIQLAGVTAAKFILWPLAVTGALLLARISAFAGLRRRGIWYAMIILFTSTTFTDYISDGKVEVFAAALGLAAIYWALTAETGAGQRAALALAGLFAGFACLAKISYLATFLPPLYFLVAWRQWHAYGADGQRFRGTIAALAPLTLWTSLPWIPHLIKNSLLFSAPFAPFFGASGEGIINQTWFSTEITQRIVATYPFALTFGRYPMQGGNLSFLLLAFLPLALLLPRAVPLLRSTLGQLAVAALLGTVIWVLVRPSVIAPRYLLATLLLFVPLAARAAEAAEAADARNGWLRLGILATVMMGLAIFIYPHRKLPGELVRHALGNASPCKLASPYCAPLRDLNQRAAAGDRVFFAGYYGFWLRPDLLQCRNGRDELKLIESAGESSWSVLAERGFRFVVVEPDSHGRALERLKATAPPTWLTVTTLYEKPVLVIYEIAVRAPLHQPLAQCRQVTPPAWDIISLR